MQHFRLISDYAETWRRLLEYDENGQDTIASRSSSNSALDYDYAVSVIEDFKQELTKKSEATPLFGKILDNSLDRIFKSIEQTMFEGPLYQSREEKAANLLYLIVKDHPFADGNKRIGSLLFLLYLTQEGMPNSFDARLLLNITLTVAESKPDEKDSMIRVVTNLLLEQPS